MKAAVLKRIGDEQLEVRDDVTATAPEPDEVRARVKAAGAGNR